MAGPITWRNVGGGGGSSAASFMNMGQQQIQQGMDTIAKLVEANQKAGVQNFEAVRSNNTDKYLDQVAAAGGIEALQNPEIRAQLEATRSGFGAAIDREATRNSIDDRVTGLQRAASVSGAYNDQEAERGQRGAVDNLYALAQAGDKAGVQKVLDETQFFKEGDLRANLMGTFDAADSRVYRANAEQRAVGAEGRAIGAEGRAIESHVASLDNMRESLLDRREARDQRNSDRDYAKNVRVLDDAAKQAQGMVTANEVKNPFAGVSVDPNKDATAILSKTLPAGEYDSLFNSNTADREQMTKGITDLLRVGVEAPDGSMVKIPPTLITQALNNRAGKWWITDNPMTDVESYFKDMLKDPDILKQVQEGQEMRTRATSMVRTLQQAKTKLGSSKSLDTSGIVAELQALSGGAKASSNGPSGKMSPPSWNPAPQRVGKDTTSALMPEREED